MPEPAPPISPLHHLSEPQWQTESGSVVLEDRSLCGKFVVHGKADDPALEDAVSAAFGLALPSVNKATEAGGRTLAWLGPKEWLALCPADQEAAAAEALRAARVSHVSVGHGRALISLSGSRSLDLLRKGTSLDVHPRSFAPGDCAQTRLARLAVLLIPREPEGFDMICDRGFAEYLWLWLKDAAREFAALDRISATFKIVKVIKHPEGIRKVEIFERRDGTFGFDDMIWYEEEKSWGSMGGYSECRVASLEEAVSEARSRVSWLAKQDR